MAQDQSLEQKIHNEYTQALRKGDAFEVATLRMLLSALQAKQIEKRGAGISEPLTNEEICEVIVREVKKRKESAKMFREGKRDDLAEKEDAERVILERYLPPQASEEEIDEVITRAFSIVRPEGQKDMGRVIAEAMKFLKGRADGATVSAKVKERFSSRA